MNPQVVTTSVETTDVPPDCGNCGAEYAGVNAFSWGPRWEPDGSLEVCDDPYCIGVAERTAFDESDDVRCEISVYPYALEAAA